MRWKSLRQHLAQESLSWRVCLGVCLVFALIHILFFHDKFFDINRSKYYLLLYGLYSALLIVGACFCYEKPWRRDLNTLRMSTLGLMILLFSAAISLLMTKNPLKALTGSDGRYAGGLLFAAEAVLYGFGMHVMAKPAGAVPEETDASPGADRLMTPAELIVCALLLSGSLCAILGIANFLGWDPLGFYTTLNSVYQSDFISTIGNINFFSAYMVLMTALAAGLYLQWDHRMRPWMLAPFLLFFLGVLASHSDSGFAGLAMLALTALAFKPRQKQHVERLLIMPGLACLAACLLSALTRLCHDSAMDFSNSFTSKTLNVPFLSLFLGLFFLSAVAVLKVRSPSEHMLFRYAARIRIAVFVAVGLAAVAFAGMMIYYTRINPLAEPPASIFRMDDNWGTFRGFIWRKTVSLWSGLPFMQKLFGIGPDSLRALLVEECYDEMISLTGLVFDSAHNELLHLLITVGALGVAGYLVLVAGALRAAWKAGSNDPVRYAAFMAICVHMAQSMLNIAQPETTPAVYLIFAIAASSCMTPMVNLRPALERLSPIKAFLSKSLSSWKRDKAGSEEDRPEENNDPT